LGFEGWGVRVWGPGFRVQGSGFGVFVTDESKVQDGEKILSAQQPWVWEVGIDEGEDHECENAESGDIGLGFRV
jgi:hypothetical protein